MSKFETEKMIVEEIISKETITHEDRIKLLKIYQVPYHDSGKIEGIFSCDSSCNNCNFCQTIREKGKSNPLVICNYCYDNEQENRWNNVKNRHGLQLGIMSSVEFTEEELSTLKIVGICRFNSSGDIQNITMAKNYLKIAKSHPMVKFALWAKNVYPVIIATNEIGKPENCVYIQSSILIGKPSKKSKYFDYVFTVYPDEKSTENAIKNGACECNGKKCFNCGYKCYYKAWGENANIAEFLRIKNSKQRERILKELNKK